VNAQIDNRRYVLQRLALHHAGWQRAPDANFSLSSAISASAANDGSKPVPSSATIARSR
jgi:hypothetical protein